MPRWTLPLSAAGLLIACAATVAAETHPDVQYALDWTLPAHRCEAPPASFFQPIVDSDGVPSTSRALPPSQERLMAKKKKKFDACIESYKRGLVKEFGRLKDVAKHGLTQEQASTILAKLALIQAVVQDPLAEPPPPSPQAGDAP